MIIDTWALDAFFIAAAYFAVCAGTSFVLDTILSATKFSRVVGSLAPLLSNAIKVDTKGTTNE